MSVGIPIVVYSIYLQYIYLLFSLVQIFSVLQDALVVKSAVFFIEFKDLHFCLHYHTMWL